MEFLDSIDLDTKDKKSNRVRSWYLYEQYKALEKHQLDAAQKLKDRSYQDKLLRQELSERRARRKLYDQFGPCQSESRLQKKVRSSGHSEPFSVSNDEFFESFSEQEGLGKGEERVTRETEFDDVYSQDLSRSNYSNETEDMKSINEQNDNCSYSDSVKSVNSVNSVVENTIPNDECGDYEFTIESDFTTMIIAQDINKQLDDVKQNIQSMENVAKLQDLPDDDKLSVPEDDDSLSLGDNCILATDSIDDSKQKKYNNIILVWSRLVSFAYQIVQLNHGNCYCDYSSQFLTAVLACDVLRRGVNRMCRILQPYVSPTKFATDESDESECCHKYAKIKKSAQSRKSRKRFENKLLRRSKRSHKPRHAHRKYSENTWQPSHRRSSYEWKKPRHTSETLQRPSIKLFKDTSSSSTCSIWAQNSKKNMSRSVLWGRRYYKKAVNPMLEIARYLDSILKDMNHL